MNQIHGHEIKTLIFIQGGRLSGGVKLTKNVELDKYSYGIGFNTRIEYCLTDNSAGKNFIIFKADMSSSVHIDNKGKHILILGKGPTQELNNTTLTAKTQYSVNITRPGMKFYLSLHNNRSNRFFIC